MERDVPHIANDVGAPIIAIGVKEFNCIGETPPFDHPHIYLTMGDESEIVCPYCGTLFRYDPSVPVSDARPVHRPLPEAVVDPDPVSPPTRIITPREPTPAEIFFTQVKIRIAKLARSPFVWFLLILVIEAPVAKAFEWISEHMHWLETIEAFQKEFAEAVDQLQPWHVYDIFSKRSGELAAEVVSGNQTPEGATPLLISWSAFRYTIRDLAVDPNPMVGRLTAIGLAASFLLSVYVGATKKPRGINWDIYVFLWLLFGIAAVVVAFSAIFVVLKASMSFGALLLGRVVELAKLYGATSLVIALIFLWRVRSEHAIVEWLKERAERLWPRHRDHDLDRWGDPEV